MRIKYDEIYRAYLDMCDETERMKKMMVDMGVTFNTYYMGTNADLDKQIKRQAKYELIYCNIYSILYAPGLDRLMRAIRKFEKKENESFFDFRKNENAIERFLEQ